MSESQSAYARRHGWSPQYVSKLVKQGKIPVDGNRKIDPEVADAALAAVREPNRVGTLEANARARAPREIPASGYVETPLSKAKAEDAEYAGKLRKLEYEREVGLVIEAARVEKAIADGLATITSQLRTLSIRVAPKIVGETDLRRIQDAVDSEVDLVCQETADTLRSTLANSGVTRQ